MKQESPKKSKLWLWLVIALAALVAVGGVLLALLLPGQQTDPQGDTVNAELYWNLDREQFIEEATGLSTRTKEADGLYHMRFAYKGEQVDRAVTDKQLVNFIDSMNVVGLVLDADGIVIDAVDPQSFLTVIAKDAFVRKVEEDTLVTNSSQTMNGMESNIPLTDNTGIYDVSEDAQIRGASATPALMDTVTVYGDAEGNATHVYITKHPVTADVYWRVGSYYDSANVCTTRVPDENGVYTMLYACNGEQVELKCRDRVLVNRLDSYSAVSSQAALLFDEEGYVIDNTNIALAIRGMYLCKYYTVTAIEGDQVTVERIQPGTEQGIVKTFTLGKDCDIFMCCSGCHDSHIGERTDHLRIGDTVDVYTDLDGVSNLIFVSTRPVDSKLYYNLAQKYNSVTKETRREPENGWYVFEMFCEGKTVTVKTKDKAVADKVDSMLVMGLKLDGNVVQRTYATRCVSGTNSSANSKYVTSVMGSIFTAAAAGSFDEPVNAIMSPDCKIYDMTGDYGVKKGSLTTIRPYDRVFVYSDMHNLVTHIFVRDRYAEGSSIYYNVSRKYDTEKLVTTRVPDENGYYVFEMITNGKTVTVKTKSKDMATFIDAQSAPTVALKVSGGIIKEAHLAHMAVKFGSKADNYVYVDKVNKDGTYTTYYYSGETRVPGAVARKIAKNCKIYNVSAAYAKYRGEITTLKPNDRIQAIVSGDTGEAVMLFVLSRELDSPLYYPVKRMYDTTKAETRRVPDADGWYVFDLAVNGQIKQFKTKDKAVASEVDQFSNPFVMITEGDVIIRACNSTFHKDVKANAAGRYDVMSIDGDKITLTRQRPLADNYGDTKELTLAKGYKVYDVSSYAPAFGAEVQLQLGDRVICYANDQGQISYIYIILRNTRKAGSVSYCEHCKKDVFWNPYEGEIYETDAHYYLTCDTQMSKGKTLGEDNVDYSVCLDLNGKSLFCKYRPFLTYTEFSILDSAGGGSLVSGCVSEIALGGCITVAGNGTLNLYGGTLTQQAGGNAPGKGGVVNVGYGTTFNMYGGAVKGGYVTDQGGNIFVNGSTFNMYGGTVEGGTADLAGGNIATAAKSTVNLAGGTITGDTVIGAGSTVILSGELTVTAGKTSGLKLSAGDVLTLGKLSEKASIVISADGIFTEEKENIADYQTFFTPFDTDDTIEIQENALAYVNIIDLNKIDNSDLVFAEGTTKAVCPVCEVEVTWTALTEKKANLVGGGHYYLADDVTYEGGSNWHILAPANGAACLHLNGKNLTSPTKAIQGSTGALNVMGNGTVTGNFTDPANLKRGAVVDTTPSDKTCAEVTAINLLGGTYVNAEGNPQQNVVSIWNNGGRIRLYAGATVKGGIYVGTSNIFASELAICGGAVEGTVALAGSSKNTSTLNLSGGNIAAVTLPVNAVCNISGNPVVAAMQLAEGAKLTLGELTEGASLTVVANGVFTAPSDLAESLVGFFHAANEGDTIEVQENALVYIPVPTQTNPYLVDLALDADGYAQCPACQAKVNWTALTEKKANLVAGGHYYLADDVTYEGGSNWHILAPANGTACLHLNSKNLTSPTKAIQGSTGALNVMGNGTVTGNYTDSANPKRGAVIDTTPSKADCAEVTSINLLGGTYMAAQGNTQENIVSIWNNGGRIRVYDGATVKGGIYVGTSGILASELAIWGGTVEGTVALAGSSKNTSTLNLSGGNIAAVTLPVNAVCNISGNPVVAAMQLAEGAKLTLGELTEGASLTVSANGVFTEAKDNISDYTTFFTPAEGYELAIQENALAGISKSTGEPEDPSTAPYDGTLELDAEGYAKCPVCNKKVLWTDLNSLSDSRLGFKNDKAAYDAGTPVSYHYYLSDDLAYGKSAQYAERYYNINCLHLNGHSLSFNSRMSIGIGATLNIMGAGSLTGSCNSSVAANNTSVLYTYNGGVINLYSGSYNCTNKDVPAVLIGSHAPTQVNIYDGVTVTGGVTANNGTVTISGDSNVDLLTIGTSAKLSVSAGWSGAAKASFAAKLVDNQVPAANGVCEDAYTGKLYLDAAGSPLLVGQEGRLTVSGSAYHLPLVLDAEGYADCPVCKEKVLWTDLNSLSDSRLGFKNDKAAYDAGTPVSYHYYLSDDLAYAKSSQYAERYYNINCLHLNGHSLSFNSRMSIGIGATLNIMGSGSLTGSCNSSVAANNTSVLYTYNSGVINLYGGAVNCTNKDVPAVLIGSHAPTQINIYDGVTVTGGVTAKNGTVTISGDSNVDLLTIGTPAKLTVSADWTGTAQASFASQITDGVIPAKNGASLGTYTGILTMDSKAVVGKDGALVVRTFDPNTDDGVLKILGIGNSYTQDSMHLLYDVYKAENPEKEIVLAFLYRGACSLNTHATYLTNNTAAYTYYKLDSQTGAWQQVSDMTMRLGILDEQWDVVTMQQNSGNSTNAATYSSKIGTIRDYVEQTLGYKPAFGWNFTWGYPDDADLLNTSTTANFAQDFFNNYGTTEAMYNKISAAVQEKIVNGNYSFDYLMPVGTAIQNSRSNHLTAKDLYRDSLHLNNLGRLIAAYTWYCELEGYNGTDKALTDLKLTQIPASLALSKGVTELDAQLEEIVIESVNNAMKNKFAVTKP